MRILISGSTGLVGSALSSALAKENHEIARLVRKPANLAPREYRWDPAHGEIDRAAFDGVDAVVHLAGESIASGRWNPARKARILDSRVQGTSLLCQTLSACGKKPSVLVSASAIGYYGNRGVEKLDESSSPGTGFLAEVCQAWEAATLPAQEAGIRTVNLRIGLVLARHGGALPKMLLPFRLGLGGRIGSGLQYMSWIALPDLIGMIRFAIASPTLAGPVNAVSPAPVTNAEFTRTLARTLHRPPVFRVPAAAIRIALGEMGRELLLSGARVTPRKLQDAGYDFRYPRIEDAFRAIL